MTLGWGSSDLKGPRWVCNIKKKSGFFFELDLNFTVPVSRGPLSYKHYPFRASKAPRGAYIVCAVMVGASSEISRETFSPALHSIRLFKNEIKISILGIENP